MMFKLDDKNTIKILMLLIILSLTIIYTLKTMPAEKIKIEDAPNYLDKRVKISGIITKFKSGDKYQLLEVTDDTGSIMVYSPTKRFIGTEIGDNIVLSGTVQYYRSQIEIVVSEFDNVWTGTKE